jgi:hypothetical protein
MRTICSVLMLVVAARPAAAAPSHTCTPVTIGDAVLDKISSDFNAGFDNQDPDAKVRGFQLHIDSRTGAIPETSFVKWPDPWPVPGADARNRMTIGSSEFLLAGNKDFGIFATIDDINATNLEAGFSCHPDEFNHALKDGAVRGELKLVAMGKDDEVKLTFKWHVVINILDVIKVDEWFIIELVDVDIPNDQELLAIAALVPEVSADGESVKLHPHVDVDAVANQLTYTQLLDEMLALQPILTATLANIVCLPTGLGSACTGPVTPFVAIVVGVAVDGLRQYGVTKIKQALSGYVKCMLEPFNRTPLPPGAPVPTCNIWSPATPGENKFIKQLGDRLREQLAKLDLPNKILALPIPNYNDVVPYEPDFVRMLCP